jgi:predicted CoA-substrate-specific enzyme activase|tara:strand:- start:25289 stop:29566 length:4278 start_codon:yes stop_codon:yes gene_type:complete
MDPSEIKIATRQDAPEADQEIIGTIVSERAERVPERDPEGVPVRVHGQVDGLPLNPEDIPPGAKIKIAIECGSTTVKVIVLDEEDRPAYGIYRKHHAKTYQESAQLLRHVVDLFRDRHIINVGFSGSSGQGIHDRLAGFVRQALVATYGVQSPDMLNVTYVNELVAQTFPIADKYAGEEVHIIEIGGEDSKYMKLSPDGEMTDNELNGECAAGTGTFIEEQVPRIGYDDLYAMIEAAWHAADKETPQIAGRCTVFAKSDITHHMKDGVGQDRIGKAVHESVADTYFRNLVGQVKRKLRGSGVVILQGGVAKNKALVRAFRDLLSKNGLRADRLVVPPWPELKIVEGAARVAAANADGQTIDRRALLAGLDHLQAYIESVQPSSGLPPLVLRDSDALIKTWRPYRFSSGEMKQVVLGIDSGSTTTKLVLLDAENHAVLYKSYARNADGNQFESIHRGLKELREQIGEQIEIVHVGVTGSAREAIGAVVGADEVIDEINAHATAACRIQPDTDTIFEIGGQDSKFIRVENGIATDFEMNKICAAGTGSFLDEAADRVLNVPVEQLGAMALQDSPEPEDLGETCAVFMKSRVVRAQALGATPQSIAAGLSRSIVINYLHKVVGGHQIGDNITFLGGATFNHATVAAFEQSTGKRISVPEHAEVMGAIGAALVASTDYEGMRFDSQQRVTMTDFRGLDADFRVDEATQDQRTCNVCTNYCRLKFVVTEDGSKVVFGAACDLYEGAVAKKSGKLRPMPLPTEDLVEVRKRLMATSQVGQMQLHERHSPRKKVLIPSALNYWEHLPFWRAFLETCGVEVLTTEPSRNEILDLAATTSNLETCLPIKVALGIARHAWDNADVDFVFMPVVHKVESEDILWDRSAVCPLITGAPHMVRSELSLRDEREGSKKFIQPEFDFTRPRRDVIRQLQVLLQQLDVDKTLAKKAYDAARRAQNEFLQAQRMEGMKVLEEIRASDGEKRGVVLLARPYSSLDSRMNLKLDAEIRKAGWFVLPMDFLPLAESHRAASDMADDTWYYQRKINQAAALIADDPDLFPIFITSYLCGPDGFIHKNVEERMRQSGKAMLTLQIDEHTATAGYKTRIDAFLRSIDNKRKADLIAAKQNLRARRLPIVQVTDEETSDIDLTELRSKQVVFIPRMSEHSILVAGALRSCGVASRSFPPMTDEAMEKGLACSNGMACVPHTITTGEVLHFVGEEVAGGTRPDDIAIMWTQTKGACRFTQYSTQLQKSLNHAGFRGAKVVNFTTTATKNQFRPPLALFTRVFQAYSLGDYLGQILLENRPYELEGSEMTERRRKLSERSPDLDSEDVTLTDLVYRNYLHKIADVMGKPEELHQQLSEFVREIEKIPKDLNQRKPLIDLIGEIFLRLNSYANCELVELLEANGCEVFLPGVAEFMYKGAAPKRDTWQEGLN